MILHNHMWLCNIIFVYYYFIIALVVACNIVIVFATFSHSHSFWRRCSALMEGSRVEKTTFILACFYLQAK